MIKKLRYKFIIITMSIVTVMLIFILGLVYFFTKNNIETTSIAMMQDIANHPLQLGLPYESSDNIHLPYFTLLLNVHGELVTVGGGYYDLSDEAFLNDLIDQTLADPRHIGTINEYHLRFCRVFSPGGQTIVYSDISSELAMLKNLMKSCAAIGVISFLAFFVLSIRLARWAVKPVDNAWQQQRQFIADASHELKTPLTVIMTNAELMQSPDYYDADITKLSSNILTMSHQMRGLVEQMLELARVDNMQEKVLFSSVNFSELVSNAILPFEPVFFEKELVLETQIAPDIIVNGNAPQLRQVIDILLDNAQKYSCKKGTTWVTLKRFGKRHLLLSVADEGDEIRPEELKHLFKRFYRTDKARSRNGSFGLGLSIAETIIINHKGKVWAESKNGINSFYIIIPILNWGQKTLPSAI